MNFFAAPSIDAEKNPDTVQTGTLGNSPQLHAPRLGQSTLAPTAGTEEENRPSPGDDVTRRLAADDDLASVEEARRLQRQFDGEAEGYRAPDAAYQECLISDEPGPEDLFAGVTPGVASLFFNPSGAARTANALLTIPGRGTTQQEADGEAGSQAGDNMSDEDYARRLQEAEFSGLSGDVSHPAGEGGVSGSMHEGDGTEQQSDHTGQASTFGELAPAVVSLPSAHTSSGAGEEGGIASAAISGASSQAGSRTEHVAEQGTSQYPIPVESGEGAVSSATGNVQNPIVLDDPDEAMLQAAIAQSLIDM